MINENEIARCVRKAMDGYFKDLDGERPCAIYRSRSRCSSGESARRLRSVSDRGFGIWRGISRRASS